VAADGLRLPLELVRDRPLTLGRSPVCDVVVSHDTVSRRHAQIFRGEAGWYVSDLGSSNGTWVGGQRVEREAPVRRGDQILLGGCLVVVV
jgi:pSer/pThr/pTyr-binding forkhead associated (FHA) protein